MTSDAPHILVVDDDTRLLKLLHQFLTDSGNRVTTAADAAEARLQLESFTFDLIVLDVMMPGESGLELTVAMRQRGNVPILLLTAMAEAENRIDGLELGADDYLSKPFEPRELLARIRSILRRTQLPTVSVSEVRLGEFSFDLTRLELARGTIRVRLTTSEARLLKALASSAGRPISREELTRRSALNGNTRAVDVQVARLRRKIEPDPKLPRYLQTVRGEGYVLRPD